MNRKDSIDISGAVLLVLLSSVLGFNQVVIKITNGGFQPVFWAGLRSAGAIFLVYACIRLFSGRVTLPSGSLPSALLLGFIFALEFLLLFIAADLTTVIRVSIIYYSMPVWLAIMAHFLLPSERLHWMKTLGLAVSMLGIAWAIGYRGGAEVGASSLIGDICALGGAMTWAAIPICVRITAMQHVSPELQLFCQLVISAPLLIGASLFFGPWFRDPGPIHFGGLLFQIVVVVTISFFLWFRLLAIYPATSVASFSFLSPLFGVFFGWALLGEPLGPSIVGALTLVCLGLYLINRGSGRT